MIATRTLGAPFSVSQAMSALMRCMCHIGQ
jgi:hypothetical protein